MASHSGFHRSHPSSFFPAFPVADFSPFLRMLAEADNDAPSRQNKQHSVARPYIPRFDVREEADQFTLHGELPGIERKDVSIDFTDNNTLVIKGRTVRESHTSNTPQITDSGTEEPQSITEGARTPTSSHQPTVEDGDEFIDVPNHQDKSSTSVVKTDNTQQQVSHSKKAQPQPQHKYWVTERSIGEFHRTFEFPGRVNQDGVKASLKNGILTVVVPKASATKKTINID
jgi:HSP20 family protein